MILALALLAGCPALVPTHGGDTDDTDTVADTDTDTPDIPPDVLCEEIDTGEPYPPVDTDTEVAGIPGLTVENWPRMDGSTATEPITAAIICEHFGIPYEWAFVGESSTKGLLPRPQDEEQAAIVTALADRFDHTGTHSAYERLVTGDVDLLLESRAPSDSELALAEAAGIDLILDPIAEDALVFLVNEANPIEELTKAQAKAIYLGEVTQWSDVGGLDAPISPYYRNEDSGSHELMEALVLEGATMPDWPAELEVVVMGALVDKVATDANGIGYTVFFYIEHQYTSPSVKPIGNECVQPTKSTIAAGTFPFVSTTYVVTRSDLDPTAPAAAMRDWLLTDEGTLVVERSGYVPYAR